MSFLKSLLFGGCLLPIVMYAQDTVLAGQLHTSYVYQHQFADTSSGNGLDTTLYNYQNYLPFNYLGNSGLAFNDVLQLQRSFDFHYFKNNYAPYFFTPNRIKFYDTHSPYSNIFYATGSKREQVFRLTFSTNIQPNWNATFDFNRIRSDGFYDRQNTNDNSVDVSTNYKSLNNRYYILGALIYNSAKNAENGGLVSDTAAGLVNLQDAKRALNEKSVFVKQYLQLGQKTGDSAQLKVVQPNSKFILSTLLENRILKYEDGNPTSGFYSAIDYDSSVTYDSAFNYKIDNELEWKRVNNKLYRGLRDQLGLSLSMKHQYVRMKQKSSDFAYNNIYLGAGFYNTYSLNGFWWKLNGNYVLNGYNENNYRIAITLKQQFSEKRSYLVFDAEHKSQSPDFMYNHYYSNHFFWNNDFENTQTTSFRLNSYFNTSKLFLGVDYTLRNRVLFFNEQALADQYKSGVELLHVYLKKDLAFFNWHLNNKVHYQSLSNSSVIRLPEFVLEHSLYYERKVFKKVAHMQIGVTLLYVSPYYANAYMPATGQFYLQNSVKTGDYPALNFFINAQVKAVRVFFKVDHLNDGLSSGSYILTPNNPMNGRAFKFGASWYFYD